MEKVEWKVEGMSCSNCAMAIDKYLQKEGMSDIKVNFIGNEVSFGLAANKTKERIAKEIEALGYRVADSHGEVRVQHHAYFSNHLQRFLFCLPFTLVLMLHMMPLHIHLLGNPWAQLAICMPVYITGMGYFGVSAIKSLRSGISNMNVLVATGATAAFVYSLAGTIINLGADYVFYETTATIITLVFLGEWIEHKSVMATQKQINKLARSQKVAANMIAFDDEHKEVIFSVDSSLLHVGDLLLIKSGEQVPVDCKILWGDAEVNESLLTGESKPLRKQKKDSLIGGTILSGGTVKAQITAIGNDTVLSNILNLVKQAQAEKPLLQQLADRISSIFVPAVLCIAVATFLFNFFVAGVDSTHSMMRSIAVLVISCPCAMGLATPAAIAVGLGRAARNGILFRDAKSLELFKNIGTVVFDKTGTITKGDFTIVGFESYSMAPAEFQRIVYSLEKYSNHPIAKVIGKEWSVNNPVRWKEIEEIKGIGMKGTDMGGNTYQFGSHKLIVQGQQPNGHTAYLLKNGIEAGWIDMEDTVRPEAKTVINYLSAKNIHTILLSGDTVERTKKIGDVLGMDEIYAEKSPGEKLEIIERLNKKSPVAMVGDGINDAPALAKATIGISMSDATQVAMQSAQVVLMNNGIAQLPLALGLGKHTFTTIKENLFWAFIYNIVAIPVAAAGFLNPGIAALAMGFSDVVLAANSVRLNYKKVC